jgi:hypothetical protein
VRHQLQDGVLANLPSLKPRNSYVQKWTIITALRGLMFNGRK